MRIIEYEKLKDSYVFFSLKVCKAIYGFIIMLIVIILAFILWSIFFYLDDTVNGDVVLRPASNVSTIRPQYSGQIVYIGYEDNTLVEKGDILFSIDTTSLDKQYDKLYKQLSTNRTEQRITNTLLNVIKTESMGSISSNSESYSRCLSYISELNRLKRIVDNTEAQYKRELEKPSMFSTKQNIEDLKNLYDQSVLQLQSFINDTDYQARQTLINLKTEEELLLKDIENTLSEKDRSVVKAHMSGTVLALKKLNIGDMVFSSEDILQIVPLMEDKLKAEIMIRTSDIARVAEGNKVRIKLTGLSPARYGYVEAEVSSVSPDYRIMADNSLGFTVEGKIENTELKARSGEEIQLKVGLAGQAKVIVGHEKAYVMLLRKLDFLW